MLMNVSSFSYINNKADICLRQPQNLENSYQFPQSDTEMLYIGNIFLNVRFLWAATSELDVFNSAKGWELERAACTFSNANCKLD